MSKDKLIERIRKLLALSRNNSNEAEAAAAAAKVQDLLVEHNLSMSQIGAETEGNSIGKRMFQPKYSDPWRYFILKSAATLYMCDVVAMDVPYQATRRDGMVVTRMRTGYLLIGQRHSVVILEEMYTYLESTVVRLSREYSSERRDQLDFQKGCGFRLSERMDRMHEEATRPKDGDGSGVPALYRTELVRLEEFKKRTFGDSLVDSPVQGRMRNAAATRAGRAAGDRVSLAPQVGAGTRGTSKYLLG